MRTEVKIYILVFLVIFGWNRYLHYENDVKLIGTNDCYNRKNFDKLIKELDEKSNGKLESKDYEYAYSLISEMSENDNTIYLMDIKDGKLYKIEKKNRDISAANIILLNIEVPSDNRTRLVVLTKGGKEIYKYNNIEQYYLTKSNKPTSENRYKTMRVEDFIASILLQYRCKIKNVSNQNDRKYE